MGGFDLRLVQTLNSCFKEETHDRGFNQYDLFLHNLARKRKRQRVASRLQCQVFGCRWALIIVSETLSLSSENKTHAPAQCTQIVAAINQRK